MTAAKKIPAKRALPRLSPIQTGVETRPVKHEDLAANAVILADEVIARTQLAIAIMNQELREKRRLLVLTVNNRIPYTKGFFPYISAKGNALRINSLDAKGIVKRLNNGQNVHVDLDNLCAEEIGAFLSELGAELNRNSVRGVTVVMDHIEIGLPRRRSGYDSDAVADWRLFITKGRASGNRFVGVGRSLNDIIIETRNNFGTYLVGLLSNSTQVESAGMISPLIVKFANVRTPREEGISFQAEDNFWLWNKGTAHLEQGMPFLTPYSYFNRFTPGRPSDTDGDKIMTSDIVNAIEADRVANHPEDTAHPVMTRRFSGRRLMRPHSTVARTHKLKTAKNNRRQEMQPKTRVHNAYTQKVMNVGVTEANAELQGEKNIQAKLAIASAILIKNHKPTGKAALVQFISNNELLSEVTRCANRMSCVSQLMTGKAFGVAYYEAMIKHPTDARIFFEEVASARTVNPIAIETRKHLAALRALQPSANEAAPKAARILSKGWRLFLAAQLAARSANDNRGELAAG